MSNRHIHYGWLGLGLALILTCNLQAAGTAAFTNTTTSAATVNFTRAYQRKVIPTKVGGGTLYWLQNGTWVPEGTSYRMSDNGTVTFHGVGNGNPAIPFPFNSRTTTFQYKWGISGGEPVFTLEMPSFAGELTVSYGGTSGLNTTATMLLPDFTVTLTNGEGTQVVTSDEYQPHNPTVAQAELTLLLNNETGQAQTINWGDRTIELQPGINAIRYDGPVDANGIPTVGPADLRGSPITDSTGRHFFAAGLRFTGLDSGELMWTNPPPESYNPPPASPQTGAPRVEIIQAGSTTQGPTVIVYNADGTRTITTLPLLANQGTPLTSGGTATLTNPTTPNTAPNSTNTVNNTTNNTINNSSTNVTNIYNNGTEGVEGTSNVSELEAEFPASEAPDMDELGLSNDAGDDFATAGSNLATKLQNFQILAAGDIPRTNIFNQNIDCGRFGILPVNIDFGVTPVQVFRALLLVCFAFVLSTKLITHFKV